jgi:hypothetical protein
MATTDVRKTLTDTGYIAIGLGVMGFQQAQARGRKLRTRLAGTGDCLSLISTGSSPFASRLLGVSADDVASHEKFRDKYDLNFPLLADPDHAVAEKYGAWREKNMYGKKVMGIVRTTFLIGEDGKIEKIFSKVKPEGHAEEVLSVL